MSWDVSVNRFSRHYASISDVPSDENPLPLGSQASVREAISIHFPGTDWSDPAWGRFECPFGSINFNMGSDEPTIGFMLHVRAAPDVVAPIIDMCNANGWHAIDCSSGHFMAESEESRASLKQWIAYRDQILSGGR